MGRWIVYAAIGLAGGAVVLAAAVFLLLGRFDLAPIAASRASAALGRPVTVAGLHVTPGRWLTIEVQGVRVENLPGGSQPEMGALRRLTAEVDALSLLHGPADIRRLDVDGMSLLLERTADRVPNWRVPGATPPKPGSPEDRSWFPLLRDARIHASEITVKMSSGPGLRIGVDDAAIQAETPDAPVRLTAAGSYQATAISVEAEFQSTAALRNNGAPFGADLLFRSGDATLRFQGSMTKPLSVDGAAGTLTLHAPTVATVLAVAGIRSDFKASLDLAGDLTRSDRLWLLTKTAGKLDDSGFANSSVRLAEGVRKDPDDVQVDLAFDRLDLNQLLAGRSGKPSPTPLTVEERPDPLVAARLRAGEVSYQKDRATDATVSATVGPGLITISEAAMTVLGARLQASGQLQPAGKGGRLTAAASVAGADLQQLRRAIGAGSVPMLGRLDVQASAEAEGETLESAMRLAHVSAVISMAGGSIARDLVEKASADIRTLFRAAKGMTTIRCLLAVVDMRAGAGAVSPLRIRTANGTIAGQGRFDLYRDQIDLTLGSERATTSDFALDVPFRINGSFSSPNVRPSSGAVRLATAELAKLPPPLQQAARRSACLAAR